jgi:bleomycin hydrolase
MKTILLLMLSPVLIACVLTGILQAEEPPALCPYEIPGDLSAFNPLFHFPPVNQDTTNACWSFSTLSFIESEMKRLGDAPVKLAVMFPVYYAFIEKTKKFVETQGVSRLAPGDLFPTVIDIVQTYGIVPEEVYHGQVCNSPIYNHKKMEAEIEGLKETIKQNDHWDESPALEKLVTILDNYLGKPPANFLYKGESFTPKSFALRYVNLHWQDYLLVTSFSYAPFWTFTSLNVPDNWRQTNRYYNVPLDVFYSGLILALTHGYSVAFDADIGEPGRQGATDVCFIPAYDIPAEFIDQAARDYRFARKITTDDHLMHMVGYAGYQGQDWFLVKDSWRDAWEGTFKGYFLFHEDYVRLKVLAYMVHKDALPEVRDKITDWK